MKECVHSQLLAQGLRNARGMKPTSSAGDQRLGTRDMSELLPTEKPLQDILLLARHALQLLNCAVIKAGRMLYPHGCLGTNPCGSVGA